MTREETVALVRFIKAISPAQAIDEWTPNFWHDVIGHLDFEVARNAVIAVKHSQVYVDPSDIIREARTIGGDPARHPSARTVAEAVAASAQREIAAGPASPPNAEYLRAKQVLLDKLAERDAAAMSDKPQHPPVPAAARRLAYAAACPWCGAQPGARCTNTVLGTPKLTPHAARVEAGSKAA